MPGRSTGSLGSIGNVRLPINVTVIRPPANEQQAIATAARHLGAPADRVVFEQSIEGLIVHGLTELDIEKAIFELQKTFPEIRYAKPQVAYDMGPPLSEPYYRATVAIPAEHLGTVMGDMMSRRGLIQSTREGPAETQFVVDVPVSECFGYSTTLRALTRGRGTYTVEFAGYRPAPFIGPGTDDAA